jgi:hypothetical protein
MFVKRAISSSGNLDYSSLPVASFVHKLTQRGLGGKLTRACAALAGTHDCPFGPMQGHPVVVPFGAAHITLRLAQPLAVIEKNRTAIMNLSFITFSHKDCSDTLVIALGQTSYGTAGRALHGVAGTLLYPAQPAVADGFFDGVKSLHLFYFQCA